MFVPEAASPNSPYPPIPQLTIIVAPVQKDPPNPHPGYLHPFIWQIGSQGGDGCSGDISPQVSPSSEFDTPFGTWQILEFTCTVTNLASPPGISYDGHAAEMTLGDTYYAVLVFEPVESRAAEDHLYRAISTFSIDK
jgi:hypothetical protein